LGAVEVEEAMLMEFADAPAAAGTMIAASLSVEGKQRAMRKAKAVPAAAAKLGPAAAVDTAESREVGDFCVFDAQTPVSIASNRSAAIPVFQLTLGESKTVLHYKHENHPDRPYRSIQFKNETPYSLGRGVCTVYDEGTYVGSCIVPTLKPGGDGLLPHALETGVLVRHETKRPQRHLVRLKLADGYCFSSYHVAERTVYRVQNHRDQEFAMIFDHDYTLEQPKVACTITRAGAAETPIAVTETLKDGIRLRLTLAPREQLSIAVAESRVEDSRVVLVNVTPTAEQFQTSWIEQNVVATNGPLAKHPGVLKCLEIQRSLDAKQAEIRAAVAETERLAARQDRLRKNIAAAGQDEQSARWKTELGQAEDKIVELEEKRLPALREEEKQIKAELHVALRHLTAEWSEE
jgi:hypothetical protein